MEMCLGHTAAFEKLLVTFEDLLDAAEQRGVKVVFVCKNGKDRSVLLARALLEVLGLSEHEACLDMLLLHCSCKSVMLEAFREFAFLVSG